LEVEIHGVRMIAPASPAPASCCCAHEATGTPPAFPGRGATSGLIRGLRGQPPFDGSQFPRLPWGGQPVPEADIRFIADWIDDGCPADDHQTSLVVDGTVTPVALTQIPAHNVEPIVRRFEVYTGSPNAYRYQYGELKQRMNLDCMSEAQVEQVRWAFRELYRLNKWPEDRRSYNNTALIHQNHCQHGWERFLPWHRIYLYEFEQALQDVCPGVTMPYWDFTMPRYCPEQPEKGQIIPNSFKAFLTTESIAYLKRADPQLPDPEADTLLKQIVEPKTLFTSPNTFFAAVANLIDKQYTMGKHRDRFIDALLATNALWYPLRYPAEYKGGGTINQVIHYHYPTANDMAQI